LAWQQNQDTKKIRKVIEIIIHTSGSNQMKRQKTKKSRKFAAKIQGTNHPLLGSIKGVHHFLKSFQIASVERLSARPIGRIHVSMAHVEHIGGGLRGSVLDGCGGATIRDELLLMVQKSGESPLDMVNIHKYPMI